MSSRKKKTNEDIFSSLFFDVCVCKVCAKKKKKEE